ncbi:MAG TPA: hypothetical protein VMW08_00350 [Acidimicrobiales bacterium]|nr:hypothetical protein [Acidimicrobiales bacterium]
MSYTATPLEAAHAGEIIRLRGAALPNLTADTIAGFIADPAQIWLGLHTEGQPGTLYGFLRAEEFPDPSPEVSHPGWYVRWFYIDPDHRGGLAVNFWPALTAELDARAVTEVFAISRRRPRWSKYGLELVALAGDFEHPDAKRGPRWSLAKASAPWVEV